MEQLYLSQITDIKDPNIQIMDNRDTHKEINIAKLTMTSILSWGGKSNKEIWLQNRLSKFLTLKRLVCLLEFSLETSIQVLSLLENDGSETSSSRRITKSLIINQKITEAYHSTSMTDIALISCLFQLQLLFASSSTSVLSLIFFLPPWDY